MNLMDEIAQQLLSGLPDGWRPFTQLTKLPPQTRLVLSASSAAHRLVFLLVYGQVRTATPIFEVNAQLRKSGCEVVWLFDECVCIPVRLTAISSDCDPAAPEILTHPFQ